MKKRNKILVYLLFIFIFALWGAVFFIFSSVKKEIFPEHFEIYTVTDKIYSGYSESEVFVTDSLIRTSVNIRGGRAFPFAGVGFNLKSYKHRPVNYFDLSLYDSIAIVAQTDRMNSLGIRLLTYDSHYSKNEYPITYRPLEIQLPVSRNFERLVASLSEFKTAEWWLVGMGLDKDDGLTFFNQTMMLEVFNGAKTLRGIPDEIQIKSICVFGRNSNFQRGMFIILLFIIIFFIFFNYVVLCKKTNKEALKVQMGKVAFLLKTTDKTIAEISLDVNEKNIRRLEKNFYKIYKETPLEYRRKNDSVEFR